MDKPAIKQAAIDFRQALLDWKDKEKILETFKQTRDSWTEEQLERTVLYCEEQIDYILKALNPIIDLATAGDIDEPFSMTSFTGSKVGRVLWDELSYPEITVPYEKFSELLRGGLTHDEFWKTDYYKLNLLPKKFKVE
jgi:hypothetical protein